MEVIFNRFFTFVYLKINLKGDNQKKKKIFSILLSEKKKKKPDQTLYFAFYYPSFVQFFSSFSLQKKEKKKFRSTLKKFPILPMFFNDLIYLNAAVDLLVFDWNSNDTKCYSYFWNFRGMRVPIPPHKTGLVVCLIFKKKFGGYATWLRISATG